MPLSSLRSVGLLGFVIFEETDCFTESAQRSKVSSQAEKASELSVEVCLMSLGAQVGPRPMRVQCDVGGVGLKRFPRFVLPPERVLLLSITLRTTTTARTGEENKILCRIFGCV